MFFQALLTIAKKNVLLFAVAIILLIAGVILHFYPSVKNEQNRLANRVEKYIQIAEEKFFHDFNPIEKYLAAGLENTDASSLAKMQDVPFYVYDYSITGKTATLESWSGNTVLPTQKIISEKGKTGAVLLPNGFYVWMKKPSPQGIWIALLPIQWNYFVTNKYLKNDVVQPVKTGISSRFSIVAGKGTDGNVRDGNGKILLHFFSSSPINDYSNIPGFICCIAGFFLLVYFIHRVTHRLSYMGFSKQRLLVFAVVTVVLRIITLSFPSYFSVKQWALFDPAVYHSSFIQTSLGDVLINILLLLWIIAVLRFEILKNKWQFSKKDGIEKWRLIGASAIAILFICVPASHLIHSLVAESTISFDVQNFFSLNYTTAVSIVILNCIALAVFTSVLCILYCTHINYAYHRQPIMMALSVCGLTYISFTIGNADYGLEMFVLAWILIFVFLLSSDRMLRFITKILGSGNIFWFIFFALSVTCIITATNKTKELEQRKQYAKRLAARANPVTELQLRTLARDVQSNFFQKNLELLLDSVQAPIISKSIITNTTGKNNTRYTATLYSFTADEQPVNTPLTYSFTELNSLLETRSKQTTVPGLFVFEESSYEYNYLLKREIRDSSGLLKGYVFVHIIPATSQSISPYPEIFNKETNREFTLLNNYSYAVYNDDKLITSENNFPFSTILDPTIFQNKEFALVNAEQVSELWYNAGAGKAVAITKLNDNLIAFITLFSYLFACSLILYGLISLISSLYYAQFSYSKFLKNVKFNVRERLQFLVVSLSLFSFVVIGTATILFFIDRYNQTNKEKLSNTLDSVEKQFKEALQARGLSDSTSRNIIPGVDSSDLASIFSKISSINEVELNLYDTHGRLRFSSLPLPYEKGLMSTQLHPAAFIALHNEKALQYFQEERIGSLSYLSCYRALLNNNGEAYAYLNTPYFKSQNALKQEISDFLVAIINLNAFVFLIGIILALYTTNRITRGFSLIGDKMKAVNLGKNNEPLSWKYDDEIGTLIQEYNTMVAKLEQSARQLVKTERETAWQDMAKQVAHEIKNPLTPMMLSIQYLRKQVEVNAPNVKALSVSTANTIITQIEHLNHMADEFSRFAQIGNAKKAKIDLQQILLHLEDLYSTIPNVTFHWELLPGYVYISADKSQMNRLFTNLIQNAIQSSPSGNSLHVSIVQTMNDRLISIAVKDDGEGISEAVKEKIFMPNFTTKSSGTGLGLAMCKRIAEENGGDILFSTSEAGTTFTVTLPQVS